MNFMYISVGSAAAVSETVSANFRGHHRAKDTQKMAKRWKRRMRGRSKEKTMWQLFRSVVVILSSRFVMQPNNFALESCCRWIFGVRAREKNDNSTIPKTWIKLHKRKANNLLTIRRQFIYALWVKYSHSFSMLTMLPWVKRHTWGTGMRQSERAKE